MVRVVSPPVGFTHPRNSDPCFVQKNIVLLLNRKGTVSVLVVRERL